MGSGLPSSFLSTSGVFGVLRTGPKPSLGAETW